MSVNSQAHSRLAGRSKEKLYELIQNARRIIVMDNDLTDLNVEWIKSNIIIKRRYVLTNRIKAVNE